MTKESDSIERKFRAFHRENPRVYAELLRLAREAQKKGVRRLGVRMLWEVMRWNLSIATYDPASDLKLNDHYRRRYVRWLIEKHPDLKTMFELRRLRAA